MGKENFLKVGWYRIHDYFTSRPMRKVFFFSLLFVIITLTIVIVYNVNFTLRLFFAAGAFASFISLADAFITKAEFTKKLEKLEYNRYKMRAKMEEGPLYEKKDGIFEEEERRYLKRKKKEHNYTVAVKFFVFAIFVFLLFA